MLILRRMAVEFVGGGNQKPLELAFFDLFFICVFGREHREYRRWNGGRTCKGKQSTALNVSRVSCVVSRVDIFPKILHM